MLSSDNKENALRSNKLYEQTYDASPASKTFKPGYRGKPDNNKACWQGVHEGWLELRMSKNVFQSEWKPVWCVIGTEGNLHLFTETDSPKPLYVLPLHATIVKDQVEKEAKAMYEIVAECPKKNVNVRLKIDNKALKLKWMSEIRKAVCRPNKNSMSQFEVTYKDAGDLKGVKCL